MNLFNALRILSNPATNAESIHAAMTGLHRIATRLHEQRGDAAKAGDEKRLSAIPHPGEPFSAEEQQAFEAAMADLTAEVLTPVAEFVPAQAPAVPQETLDEVAAFEEQRGSDNPLFLKMQPTVITANSLYDVRHS